MSKRSLLVPFLTIAIGGLILFAGLAGIGFYVSHAVESTRGGDRSGLFWYLPILFLGLGGLGGMGAGVLLLVVGIGAGRGSALCARLCRYALVFISIIALLLAGLSYMSERLAQREREARMAQAAEHQRIMSDMQQIRRLDIHEQSDDAIALTVATTGGLAGSYELRLQVGTSLGILYRQVSRLRLESPMTDIRRSIAYGDLFARCFGNADSGRFFVCVEGAGTANTRFRVKAELVLLHTTENAGVAGQGDPGVFSTSASADFFLDTFTRADQVEVEGFRRGEGRAAE